MIQAQDPRYGERMTEGLYDEDEGTRLAWAGFKDQEERDMYIAFAEDADRALAEEERTQEKIRLQRLAEERELKKILGK